MQNVAITGSAGFIGSWICDKAIAAGYHVIGIDNLCSNVNYTPKNVEFYNIDCNSDIKDILAKADYVVHAAAHAELRSNWKSLEQRQKLFHDNEMATRSVLEQMPDVPIVFLSSASVYGSLSNDGILPALTETDARTDSIESPYAASKLACEAYVAAWSFKRKTPHYSLRLVNQIGPRYHRGVIADFLKMIEKNQHIHAADNGIQKKNWVHVEDTSNTIIRMLDQNNAMPSGVYNVTSEERWSWQDFVRIMYDMSNKDAFKLTYENILSGSLGDPINLFVSGEKLKPYYNCHLDIATAVKDTLLSLGWQ